MLYGKTGSQERALKRRVFDEIGLCAQDMDAIVGLIVNTIGKTIVSS